MTDVANGIRSLRDLEDAISNSAVEGSLILIDLAGSTAYKTRNGESAWLSRLADFYETVERGLHPLKPVKYLGDGIFGFYSSAGNPPNEIVAKAEQVLTEVENTNSVRNYRGEHRIKVRIILGFGRAFLFHGNDPQGTSVDKLFRMEKFVPDGYIGMDQEFVDAARPTQVFNIGRFSLKGLAGGRHTLYLLGAPDQRADEMLDQARRRAALLDFWDLGVGSDGKIVVVSGYITPELGQPSTIEYGNKEALILAYQNAVKAGRLSDLEVLTSRDFREHQLKENIICIGGPYWNKVTLRFMQEVKSPFTFDFSVPGDDRTPLRDWINNVTLEAVWKANRLCKDYGFFARFSNPFNPDRDVILACGIETQAVAGIVQVFSEEQNEFLNLHETLLGKGARRDDARDLPDFFALMPFDVEDNGSVHLPGRVDQVGHILTEWDLPSNYVSQSCPAE